MVTQLAGDGWECHIAMPAPSPLAEEFAAAGAKVHVVPMRRLTASGGVAHWVGYLAAWPLTVGRLALLGRRLRVDVVHSNSLHSWYGWAVAALLERPHVWHAREIVVQSAGALRVERLLASRFANRVVAISDAVAAQLDGTNITVVRDGPDLAAFGPERAGAFRARVGIDDAALVVGALGRIDTWKGVDVLLDAMPELRRRRPEAVAAIAGPAVRGKEAYADALAARAAAIPGVHWLGPRDDPAEMMADLDVFALPSTSPEPYGLVVVEALASGVPVVATAAGGPVEILATAGSAAGHLVPPGDPEALAVAIAELLPAASSTLRRRARRSFDIAPPPAFGPLFDEVAAGGRRRPRRQR